MSTLLWLDFETGDLDPKESSPIEICIIETNFKGEPRCAHISKIVPELPVSEGAAAVNGYTEEKWKEATPLKEVAERIGRVGFLSGARWAGWNIPFDLGFWNKWFAPHVSLGTTYQPVDLFGMAWPHTMHLPKISLKHTYYHFFGKELPNAHTARGDVLACTEIYRKLLERHTSLNTEAWGSY